jgi:stage V sporulation protein G
MMVTAVSMRVVEREKVKAFASITLDDEFVVHDLRIIEGQKGLFVAMPSRKLPNGEFRDVAHPIKPEVREMIQVAVLEEYERRKEEGPEVPEVIEDAVYTPPQQAEQSEATAQTVE